MSQIQIVPASVDHYPKIAAFAEPLWYQHYSPIIGEQQVAYMLEKFQSVAAIKEQYQQGYCYYLVLFKEKLVGYFAVQYRQNNSLFVSKFYLGEAARGKGFGKMMLAKMEEMALKQDCDKIELSVNKQNSAFNAYLKLGFVCQKAIQFDIGEGYVMDDYWMVKDLLSNTTDRQDD